MVTLLPGGGKLYDNTGMNVYLAKTDINGTLQWEKASGGMNADVGGTVRRASDGG
jgi:hypothetical protein